MAFTPPPPIYEADPTPDRRRRPHGSTVQLLVVHAVSEEIVWPDDPRGYVPVREWLSGVSGVSADVLVYPDGGLLTLNPDPATHYTWHAGLSIFDDLPRRRRSLNHLSLGAEVVVPGRHTYATFRLAIQGSWVSAAQFRTLGWLLGATWGPRFSLGRDRIVGHSTISGDDVRGAGRGKRDPGTGFDWARFDVYYRRYTEVIT